MFLLVFFLVLGGVCVRAHPPSTKKKTNKNPSIDTSMLGFLLVFLRAKSLSSYFIRIFFTSKPIHELRLDLNVANTVIALTIRVI